MLNVNNTILNNNSATEFVEGLKKNRKQYPVLTFSEERKMIDSLRYDNDAKLRDLLVMHNIRYVFKLSKSYAGNTEDYDDLIGRGLMGLVIASKKFDYDFKKNGKNVKFNTFATSWIKKYMRHEFNDLNEVNVNKKCVSFDDNPRIKNDTDSNTSMENYLEDKMVVIHKNKTMDDDIATSDMRSIYNDIFNFVNSKDSQLSSVERKIFVDSYFNNRPTKDIAEDLKSNVTTVINKKKKVLKKVKSMLAIKKSIRGMSDIKEGYYSKKSLY